MRDAHWLRISNAMLVLALTCSADTVVESEDSWPSFQNGGRVSLDVDTAEGGYTLSDDMAWTATLPGYGQSSPVVWNRQVYVTSVSGPNKETYHISAHHLDDGRHLWETTIDNASPQESTNYVSRAAPTPAADANGLVVFFEGGNLLALSHGGEVRWERNLVDDYGAIGSRHGLSASVEQDDMAIYIWVERSEDSYVLSVNKRTGETNWKVEGLGATSWASPRLIPVGDGHHLVLSALGVLVGLAPDTGERLWTTDKISRNSAPTPIPLGEGRFLIGATVGREESSSGNAAESNGLVAIARNGEGDWQAEFQWRAERATSSFGSPIAHKGVAYFLNKSGVLYGLDLETGEEQFAQRLAGSSWATPVGAGSRVYFFGTDGRVNTLSVRGDDRKVTTWESLPASPKPQEGVPTAASSGSTLYAAVWCGNIVLMRRGDQLFAVRAVNE